LTSAWSPEQLQKIAASDELDIAVRRADGSLRRWTTIWVVRVDENVYVRTWYRRTDGWFGQYCGVTYDALWMNWYRDHRDSTSWHADRPANVPETAIVPVLSLGATRRFLIRPNAGGRSRTFIPAGGDALIMQGRCQRDWQHSVPKQQTPAGPRISVNFSSTTQAEA
jgi:hypothetical protein